MIEIDGVKEESEIVGRGGLRIPMYEWAGHTQTDYRFIDFFQRLWKLNGYDTAENFRKGYHESKAFSHELAIPATTDKPITILRASYVPEDKNEVEFRERLSHERAQWGQWSSVDVGVEEYGIYVLPPELGPLVPLLDVRYSHQHGGSGNQRDYGPSICRLGIPQSEHKFRPEDMTLPVQDIKRITRDNYSQHMQQLMAETVEFLS